MSKNKYTASNRKSKRERRNKFIIYLMVIAMILSLFTGAIGGLLL